MRTDVVQVIIVMPRGILRQRINTVVLDLLLYFLRLKAACTPECGEFNFHNNRPNHIQTSKYPN
jgi:hypothetical protein